MTVLHWSCGLVCLDALPRRHRLKLPVREDNTVTGVEKAAPPTEGQQHHPKEEGCTTHKGRGENGHLSKEAEFHSPLSWCCKRPLPPRASRVCDRPCLLWWSCWWIVELSLLAHCSLLQRVRWCEDVVVCSYSPRSMRCEYVVWCSYLPSFVCYDHVVWCSYFPCFTCSSDGVLNNF